MPSGQPTRQVAIIGGGPAGAHCGSRLAAAGFRVTLFEPRSGFEKPCGGGIPSRGLTIYPFLNHPALPSKRIAVCRLISPRGREAIIPLPDPLVILSRADLHRFLLRRAVESGAEHLPHRVASFERRTSGWYLRTVEPGPARAVESGPFDYLVAADGAAGAARRRLLGSSVEPDLAQGIGYYVPGLSEESIILKFYPELRGYLWVFPRADHSSVGICGTLGARPASDLWRLLDRFIVDRYGADHLRRSKRYAALIPGAPRDPARATVQGPGWALVGDSGRFVDPLTREGIFYAMRTADLLADAVIMGWPERYAKNWSRAFGRDLAWASRHAGGFFDARFTERMVAICAGSPTVSRVMSNLIAGRQPYRTLKVRLAFNGPLVAWELAKHRLAGHRRSAGAARYHDLS